MSKENLTQEKVHELFDYRADGNLVWKVSPNSRAKIGDIAGCVSCYGYILGTINKKSYRLHRIVWLWHHGYFPENQIDHINRIRTDNRIENLREVTPACNMRNKGNMRTNTSGVKGVSLVKKSNVWIAQISIYGKNITVGSSPDFAEAVCHRLAAEQAINWSGCDSSSPAFKFVQLYIGKTI